MIAPHSMTIYNGYVSGGAQAYQRTQVTNVKWENRKASNVIRSGLLAADSVMVYIPLASAADYLAPKAWQAAKAGKWTLQNGDYMVKGLVADEITGAFTITSLKAKYDDVVQIRSVDTMDSGSDAVKHWEVSGQ